MFNVRCCPAKSQVRLSRMLVILWLLLIFSFCLSIFVFLSFFSHIFLVLGINILNCMEAGKRPVMFAANIRMRTFTGSTTNAEGKE